MSIAKYKVLDHTADLAIEVYGKTKEELFLNAAYAFYNESCKLRKLGSSIEKEISIFADDVESLLIKFLNELIYLFEVNKIIGKNIKLKIFGDTMLKAKIVGGNYQDKCEIKKVIKAATYHDVKIVKNREGYKVKVVFDL